MRYQQLRVSAHLHRKRRLVRPAAPCFRCFPVCNGTCAIWSCLLRRSLYAAVRALLATAR